MDKTVVELFAGVGGFRVGFNHITKIDQDGRAIENPNFDFVWANQWEPSTSIQPAFQCYQKRFGESTSHVNKDIAKVDAKDIPNHTVLVGGFPCQDYSVARSLSGEKGIQGKKGVLFWEIIRIIKEKQTPFILLENVDRLLKSPSKQRGRDFGIMLRALGDLGYLVQWRIINAADYGHPQRRRRVFIFAAKNNTKYFSKISSLNPRDVITQFGIFSNRFQVNTLSHVVESDFLSTYTDLVTVSDKFHFSFENAGVYLDGKITTGKANPILSQQFQLQSILDEKIDDDTLYLKDSQIKKFEYLKGAKKVPRTSLNGMQYFYSEGGMAFPDDLTSPARTMLTSEGTINRSTHVVQDPISKQLRKLSPNECEKINEFPAGWTNSGMSKNKRYFMMGNALVCGVVRKLGDTISEVITSE
ncbi:MAG: DNA (cytosine-5-)-methyltransferase [Candidatus Izemoplasmatales bacterium]|nr:DNA (cytosine-5-)-methyltransferase [Candidatus Izemoplasmatales bacterium]